MEFQKLFKSNFIVDIASKLARNESIGLYSEDKFPFSESAVISNPRITTPENLELLMPDGKSNYDFENSIKVYEAYKSLTPTQATDYRIWTYLAHVNFWDYMKKRWPIENQPVDKNGQFILEHWFLNGLSASNLTRHGISLLWWGAYTTHDPDREDPYELTKELFSMLDYTRTLISGIQGRNKNFTHAILEFAIENKDLFSSYKESRIRFLMRRINYSGGYKILPSLSKAEIKKLLETYKSEIGKIAD